MPVREEAGCRSHGVRTSDDVLVVIVGLFWVLWAGSDSPLHTLAVRNLLLMMIMKDDDT